MTDINALIERTCVAPESGPFETFKNCFLQQRYAEFEKTINDLDVYDTDIWVTSFPKTGTTWTQEMVYLIVNDCDFQKANKEMLYDRFPFLEVCTLFNKCYKSMVNKSIVNAGFNRTESIGFVRNMKNRPRLIKTHLPWDLLPEQIRSMERRPKIIHVARNPKDSCTSYYYHYRRSHFYTGDFEEFCKLFLADKVLYAPFWENVLGYWQRRNEPNILFIRYEDLKKNMRNVLQDVAKFLDKSLTESQMDQLEEHLSFDRMKDNSACNFEHMRKEGHTKFMRKGIIGDFKNIMSAKIIEEFDEWTAKNSDGLTFEEE